MLDSDNHRLENVDVPVISNAQPQNIIRLAHQTPAHWNADVARSNSKHDRLPNPHGISAFHSPPFGVRICFCGKLTLMSVEDGSFR